MGNDLRSAMPVAVGRSQVLRNVIGGGDRHDYYSLSFASRSSFKVLLDKLKRNADLALLDAQGNVLQGNVLQSSENKGVRKEAIARTSAGRNLVVGFAQSLAIVVR